MGGRQCSCKKGYVSGWDGRCANCRSKKEQEWHQRKLHLLNKIGEHRDNLDWHRMYNEMDEYGKYDEFKRILKVIVSRNEYFKNQVKQNET